MQFGGQRTDMELNPIGKPHDVLIKMTDDVVPEPDAILVTGITPQRTLQDGISEVEFLKLFSEEIAVPGTIFVGFNTVRFDDEFMRFLLYRNFYDAYEWQWMDGKSRWDLLDLVRMTRALRPEGIKWPVDSQGIATNRLELLASINGLIHENAHDALSDVMASIELAKLIKTKQPDLFNYLLKIRTKDEVKKIVNSDQAFVYTSGKYASEFEKTTVVATVCEHPSQSGGALEFDLRHDPTPYASMDAGALAEAWRRRRDDSGPRLPVKTLKYNRCPAIAPLGVLDEPSQQRLGLDQKIYMENFKKLQKVKKELCSKIKQAVELLDKKQQAKLLEDEVEVDSRLYDGFFGGEDKTKMGLVRSATGEELNSIDTSFHDQRLQTLLSLYKARNYSGIMTDEDRTVWENYRNRKLLSGGNTSRLGRFFACLGELAEQKGLSDEKRYLLEELQLYGQSIMPEET